MNMQSNQVEIGKALLEGITAHDLSQWEALLADDYTGSYPSMRSGINRQLARGYNEVFLVAFPDLHFEIQRTVVNEEVVVYQWLGSGTHDGPLTLPTGTIPATGKYAAIPGVLITTVKEGKIMREETYWNQVELLAQLGIM